MYGRVGNGNTGIERYMGLYGKEKIPNTGSRIIDTRRKGCYYNQYKIRI